MILIKKSGGAGAGAGGVGVGGVGAAGASAGGDYRDASARGSLSSLQTTDTGLIGAGFLLKSHI